VTITNNIVVSNVGTAMRQDGDGIYVWGDTSQARLVNNTIAFNSGEGVETADASTALVRNNIIVGNEGVGIYDRESRAAFTIDHNDVWDNGEDYLNVTPGAGDISADPLFVDVANGDYHLQVGSPCIDKGTSVGAPTHDIAGTPRDAAPDMGAYEWTGFHIFLPLTLRSFGP
jgi:parallel beta-helix repeat protein